MSCINIKTLVILSRRKTNIIQEVKGLMNKLCFVSWICIYIKTLVTYTLRRKTNIIQEVNYALFYCLGGRLVSMQNFRLIVPLFTGFYMVVACIILFCQDYQ